MAVTPQYPSRRTTIIAIVRLYRAAVMDYVGKKVEGYDVEISYCLTAFLLGIWILCGHAISSVSPSVRGLRLLSYAAHWFPWSVDLSWGVLLAVPAALQLWHRWRGHFRRRIKWAMLQAMTFSFISLLLFLDFPPSTGVVMYSVPAFSQLLVMRKLIRQQYDQ